MVPALSVVYKIFTNSNLKECRGIGKIYSYRLTCLRQSCDSMTRPGVHSLDELRSKEAVIRRDRQAVRSVSEMRPKYQRRETLRPLKSGSNWSAASPSPFSRSPGAECRCHL